MEKKFKVTCTQIQHATLFIRAETEEEALEWAQQQVDLELVDWDFGEATADHAEETDNPDEDDFIN